MKRRNFIAVIGGGALILSHIWRGLELEEGDATALDSKRPTSQIATA